MPAGLLLRSNWTATCIAEYQGELSLDSFCAATGTSFGPPVPLDRFIDYGMWVQQQVAPDVDRRLVEALETGPGGFRLTLADGTAISARRVVVAAGIELFANRPAMAAGLPSELASHTGDHRDFRRFRGARVLVVGGGQSALECAALLQESGARAEVAVRQDHMHWLHGGKYQRMLGRYARLVYAPTDVGPMGLSRLVAVPDLFRRLPRRAQDPLAYRSIRPAGAAWLPPRLTEVPIRLGRTVVSATARDGQLHITFADGDTQTVDHLLFGTGYRVDITRYPFLTAELTARIRRAGGYPLLGRGDGIVRAGSAFPRRSGRVELRADRALRVRRLVHRPRAGAGHRRPVPAPWGGRASARAGQSGTGAVTSRHIASRAADRSGPVRPRRGRGGDRRRLPGPGYRAQSRKARHPGVPHR